MFSLLRLMCVVGVVDVVLSIALKQFCERLNHLMATENRRIKVENKREEDVNKLKLCRRNVEKQRHDHCEICSCPAY